MKSIQQFFLIASALFGFSGVAAGAFGAHLLKTKLSIESLQIFEVGVRYQMYHALALLVLVGILFHYTSTWLLLAGCSFILGICIFSGSLYLLVGTGYRYWGAVTPIGGVFFLLGWLSLLLSALSGRA